jgi:hypothetical protein
MNLTKKHSPVRPGWLPLGSDGLTDEERLLKASILPAERSALRDIYGGYGCGSYAGEPGAWDEDLENFLKKCLYDLFREHLPVATLPEEKNAEHT